MATVATSDVRSTRSRAISVIEFLLAGFVVIGHNVFRVFPNEVPILALAGLISSRLRDGTWKAIGLRRPRSWKRTVLIALGVAALRLGLGELVEAAGMKIWHQAPDLSQLKVNELTGNVQLALLYLLLVWTFAAFGEELGYRGYLLGRGTDAGGGSRFACVMALILSAVLFGFGHYYKGPVGIVDSAVAGLVLGGAYLLSQRNLWVPILAHGLIDTIGIMVVFFGWQS